MKTRMVVLMRLLFCVAITQSSNAAHAQQQDKAEKPLLFTGDSLPMPAGQNAKWEHADNPLTNAAAALFELGLPNPQGLEYREIEITVGNPWSGGGQLVKTHGWILPKAAGKAPAGDFAIAWNGLVYPVARIGDPANVRQDWSPQRVENTDKNALRRFRFNTSEAISVGYDFPSALKMALLLRVGEVEAVKWHLSAVESQTNGDPWLSLAQDWTWFAFERAVCAHMRGDDRLALLDARLLTRVRTLIDAEAMRRGIAQKVDFSSPVFRGGKMPRPTPQPYLPFLTQLPEFLADCERRVARPPVPPPAAGATIAALIEDLENVDERQWAQPGDVWLEGNKRVQALVERGNEAVEPLLAALETDTRLTRSVSFGRDFHRYRHLIPVSQAAFAALSDLLKIGFQQYDDQGEPRPRKEVADQMRAYWKEKGALSPMDRLYATLRDDRAPKSQWMEAAYYIAQPTNVEKHRTLNSYHPAKPGEQILPRGEKLRDGREPSVSQLLARRSDELAALRPSNVIAEEALFHDAAELAFHLAAWDKAAALPVLQRRLARVWEIGADLDYPLAAGGKPVERFGRIAARMTLLRVELGDDAAYDEYADWMRTSDLQGFGVQDGQCLQPLVQSATRPRVAKALDSLFNDPTSSWSKVTGEGRRFWPPVFWQTSLPMTPEFRKQALRGLADQTDVGKITFLPPDEGSKAPTVRYQFEMQGFSATYSFTKNDPDLPPVGEPRFFRVCDAYANAYAGYQRGPVFELFWPDAKRDAAVAACRAWLEAKE